MEYAGVPVVDDHDIADIGAAEHGEFDGVFFFYGEVLVVEEGLDLFRGGQPARVIIEIDLYHIVATEAHAAELFGFGDEEILHEPPVEKRALRGDADDLEFYDIAKDPFGMLGGGNQPIFSIVIEEYGEVVTDAGAPGNESLWKQDTVPSIVEDEPEIQFF